MKTLTNENLTEIKETLGFNSLELFNDIELHAMYYDIKKMKEIDNENLEIVEFSYKGNSKEEIKKEMTYDEYKKVFFNMLRIESNSITGIYKNGHIINETKERIDKIFRSYFRKVQTALKGTSPKEESVYIGFGFSPFKLNEFEFNAKINLALLLVSLKDNFREFTDTLQHFNFVVDKFSSHSGILLKRGKLINMPSMVEEDKNIDETVKNKNGVSLEEIKRAMDKAFNNSRTEDLENKSSERDEFKKEIIETPEKKEITSSRENDFKNEKTSSHLKFSIDIDLLNPDVESIDKIIGMLNNLKLSYKK